MTAQTFVVNVLLRREGDMWAAQCLDYDIAAQGKTLAEAKRAFERTFVSQIMVDVDAGKQPLEGIGQAPLEYWQQFETAEKLQDRRPFYIGDSLPPAYMIHARAGDVRVAA